MPTIKTMRFAGALLAGLWLLPQQAAAQFNQFYFFGDRLSDAGSFKPALPPGTGLFTTNPGPIPSFAANNNPTKRAGSV